MSYTLEKAIESFRELPRHVILAGAGISRAAPTSIPLFREINRAVIDALDPDSRIVAKYATSQEEAYQITDAMCGLQPERLLGELKTLLGYGSLRFLAWMLGRKPNPTHQLIAQVAAQYNVDTILTTNFDLLLEKVLPEFEAIARMKSMTHSHIAAEYYYAALGFRRVDIPVPHHPGVEEPTIFHLHGSLTPATGEEAVSGLDLTLQDTSEYFDYMDELSLGERLEGAAVLVVGYSGNDVNDVLPIVRECGPSYGMWIQHSINPTEASPGQLPTPWEDVFPHYHVVKGESTEILAAFADALSSAHPKIEPVTEFVNLVKRIIREETTSASRERVIAHLARVAGYPKYAVSYYRRMEAKDG